MSSSNPRRSPVTRSDAGSANVLTLKTNMVLRKGATFHSPTSPSSPETTDFRPPPLPRSQTNLDDVLDAHRRRVALTLGNIDKTLTAAKDTSSSSPCRSFRDDSLSVPQGILDHTIMTKEPEQERRILRLRTSRRPSRYHESDSGLGTSIATSGEKRAAEQPSRKGKTFVKTSAITRSAAASSTEELPGLSPRATNRIYEHTLKPLLAKRSLKDFHPLVLECPRKIQRKEIVCLRDLEKTLLLIAPERAKVPELFLKFCLTSIRCIQATVEYLTDREQTRPSDLPYSNGYFVDLVEQIHQYAQQLADAKAKESSGDQDEMDVKGYGYAPPLGADLNLADQPCRSDEIKLHGGITVNGRPAELVRVKSDGQAFSIATGMPVELDEDAKESMRIKRSASEELEDQEEIMRSMARRKKNAPPEEYAPKKCREPGCDKQFKRPCDLTKHEKTHSRPWKCPVSACKYHEYGWPTEKERDRHLNDKHSANPPMYECQFKPCPYKSKRESNCKQHMEKAHGWTYVRTKSSGRNRTSDGPGSAALPTPQPQNLPTPVSDTSIGAATPPQDQWLYGGGSIDFPAYNPDEYSGIDLPQEIQIDYSPLDHGTPSTDSSLDHNSAYQDLGQDFTVYDDIYSAHARLPTPFYSKDMAAQFVAFSTTELCPPQAAPHISPTGQGNAMLFTPASLAEVDEEFEDFPAAANGGRDFILFPADVKSEAYEALFDEMPSVAAGYSQPNSQTLLQMDWHAAEYGGYSQH